MTKPHEEEEWRTGEGALSGALYHGDAWIGSFINPVRAKLAAQAPKMVARLLEVVAQCPYCGGTGTAHVRNPTGFDEVPCPTCDDDRATLRAAGVLP